MIKTSSQPRKSLDLLQQVISGLQAAGYTTIQPIFEGIAFSAILTKSKNHLLNSGYDDRVFLVDIDVLSPEQMSAWANYLARLREKIRPQLLMRYHTFWVCFLAEHVSGDVKELLKVSRGREVIRPVENSSVTVFDRSTRAIHERMLTGWLAMPEEFRKNHPLRALLQEQAAGKLSR